jgi:deoxycytidine triphosphate deaminase
MRLLVDNEIRAALHPVATALAYVMQGAPPAATELDDDNVRSTSLDLTIGEIFIPGSSEDELGGSDNAKTEHNLAQGHTAVIKTREWLRMGPRRAAIAFPPAHVSLKGLLMTNPGHVDPGYEGPLHCTVINMGHESYPLSYGGKIMRALFFELDNGDQQNPAPAALIGPIENPVTTQLLARLSFDFVDVEKRAKSIAESAISTATWRATLISALIPIGLALLTFLGTLYWTPLQTIKDDIVKLRSDISNSATKLEEKESFHNIDTKLNTLKVEFAKADKFDEVKGDVVKLRNDLNNSATKLGEKEDFHNIDTKLNTLRSDVAKVDKFDERLKAVEGRLNAGPGRSQKGRKRP